MPAFLVHKKECTKEWPVLVSRRSGTGAGGGNASRIDEGRHSPAARAASDIVTGTSEQSSWCWAFSTEMPDATDQTSQSNVIQIQLALASLQQQQMQQLKLIQNIYRQLLGDSTTMLMPQNGETKDGVVRLTAKEFSALSNGTMDTSEAMAVTPPWAGNNVEYFGQHAVVSSQSQPQLPSMNSGIRDRKRVSASLEKLYSIKHNGSLKMFNHNGKSVLLDISNTDQTEDNGVALGDQSGQPKVKERAKVRVVAPRGQRRRSYSFPFSSTAELMKAPFARSQFTVGNAARSEPDLSRTRSCSSVESATSRLLEPLNSVYSNDSLSDTSAQESSAGQLSTTVATDSTPIDLSLNSESAHAGQFFCGISTSQTVPYYRKYEAASLPEFVPCSTTAMLQDAGAVGLSAMTADVEEDWESMMEITTSDEAAKIKMLVGDNDTKVTDPNQCIICHRILSCKSALQMHYRTHTGERPFKCKICQRAFTTKGNLKTHMGVHRTKPPFRIFHQCPACQKKFTNAIILQQHIRLHAMRPIQVLPEERGSSTDFDGIGYSTTKLELAGLNTSVSNGSTLSITQNGTGERTTPFVLSAVSRSDDFYGSSVSEAADQRFGDYPDSLHGLKSFASHPNEPGPAVQAGSLMLSHSLQVTPQMMMRHSMPFGSPAALSSGTPLGLVTSRSSTTCNICFKSFACNSALEIHYRSHTKERPFKCHVCSRGFSTKGNMKQHLLTHKIRELPSSEELDSAKKEPQSQSHGSHSCGPIAPSVKSDCRSDSVNSQQTSSDVTSDAAHSPAVSAAASMATTPTSQVKSEKDESSDDFISGAKCAVDGANFDSNNPTPLESIQKMWSRAESLATSVHSVPPGVKKPAVFSKHQCQLCYKHFSSSSALQIHMRTHTGDKPFKCTVCERAFTTKGNLKVHMGTHMWTNTSRRGRRIFDSSVAALPSLVTSAFGLPVVSSRDAFESLAAERADADRRRGFRDVAFKEGQMMPTKIAPSPDVKPNYADKHTGDDKVKSDHGRHVSSSSGEGLANPLANGSNSVSTCATNQFLSALSCSNAFPLTAGQQPDALPTNPVEAFNFQALFSPDYSSLALSSYGSSVNSMNPFTNMANGHTPSNMQAMLWMWRNVCSVCHKVFSSQSELEDHLKGHLVHSASSKQTTVQNAT